MSTMIEKVPFSKKMVLRHLIELYNYDFSEFTDEDVNEFGLYDYKFLDYYWTEPDRYPFFIKVDGQYAGFALVRKHGDMAAFSMAEFFVMKKYRKMGVGKTVALYLFNMFKGKWELSAVEENVPAQMFWRKVIHEHSNGKFSEKNSDFDDSIFTFET